MKTYRVGSCVAVLLATSWISGADALELQAVPLAVKSPRLLGMSMDDEGDIWLGSTHRVIYRYTPGTGTVEEIKLPFDSSTSQAICVGKKVYLLGQTHPKLIIYDRAAKQFSEAALPTDKPDLWYGTEAIDGKHLYLFDRGSAGVIKWNITTDHGASIPYPYPSPMPFGGRYSAQDGAIWCGVWDFTGGQYQPLGLARLDIEQDAFTDYFPFPHQNDDNASFTDPATTFFYPHTLLGKLVPFDIKRQRWCRSLEVPAFGKRFGFIGLGSVHGDRWYFSISTYNGTQTGCDGQPYHFCNALLEFDPRTQQFAFPTLEVKDAYYQVSYHLSAGGHFFATGNNIREPDGSLNSNKLGEAVFWQSRKLDRR